MTAARTRPAWRRGGYLDRIVWPAPGGADLGLYLRVNFITPDQVGPPLEIFLTARGPGGSTLSHYGTDLGEMLSLLLQHGHSLASLRERFKRGSLARRVVERAWILAAEEGAAIDALPADLAAERQRETGAGRGGPAS